MAHCDNPSLLIYQVAIAVPIDRVFDYLAPEHSNQPIITPGARVLVPFGKNEKIGVVIAIKQQSEVDIARLKHIIQIIDSAPLLANQDLALWQWASQYYHHPLGEVLAHALPIALRQGKSAQLEYTPSYSLSPTGKNTQPEQLKRSPKQQALLALFHEHEGHILQSELSAYQSAVKALLDKDLLIEHRLPITVENASKPSTIIANTEQQLAIQSIINNLNSFSVTLLLGITGSGKTEVYMQSIAAALQQKLQVLVLLPEITLTPQLEQRFRLRFNTQIVSYHSKLTDKQRLNAWLNMQQGHAGIMLGTRSALFTPMKTPGLIIIDEEHDSSFKQQDGFRFSARDIAISRAKFLHIPIVLGSATPSLETLFNTKRKRFNLLNLPNRAGNAVEPSFQILDIRNLKLQSGLSEPLIAAIHQTLAKQEQVLLFINRRGFAPVQICHSCGWVCRCNSCDANLVIHAAEALLRCHHCGAEQNLSWQCPACKTGALQALGMGTERIEQVLSAVFTDKQIIRLDKDTTQRKGALENYLHQINQGHADIILGTQMLAKGHHFPKVTLVAILDIDSGLFSIDYRAGEKLAQLIVQVSGRAGRADKPGKVILQTRHPEHPLLFTLLSKGYLAFAEKVLQERQQASLPPFSFQALFRVHANSLEPPQAFLSELSRIIAETNTGQTQILGPVSAPMLKRAGQYRFQMLLQSPKRQDLHQLLNQILPYIAKMKQAKKVRWSLDIDPVDLY